MKGSDHVPFGGGWGQNSLLLPCFNCQRLGRHEVCIGPEDSPDDQHTEAGEAGNDDELHVVIVTFIVMFFMLVLLDRDKDAAAR